MTYRVTFYRSLVNDYGRPYETPLVTIEIQAARSRERAIAAALRRFERLRRLAAWHHLANMYSIDEDEAAARPIGS